MKKKTPCAINILGWIAFVNLPYDPEIGKYIEQLHYNNQYRYFPELEKYLQKNQIPYMIEYEEDFM